MENNQAEVSDHAINENSVPVTEPPAAIEGLEFNAQYFFAVSAFKWRSQQLFS